MMSRLASVVKRHPLITFFLLAYALSWWVTTRLVDISE